MINIRDGELLDYLPSQLNTDIDMQCLSYAIKCATEMVLKYEHDAMTQVFVEQVPEHILDILAVELRTLYYDQSLPEDTKRNLVKNSLQWYMKAGTPAVVRELLSTIFGECQIIEWWDLKQKIPYTFEVQVNAPASYDVDELTELLSRAKNTRSHLTGIQIVKTDIDHDLYIGIALVPRTYTVIHNHLPTTESDVNNDVHYGAFVKDSKVTTIAMRYPSTKAEVNAKVNPGSGVISRSVSTIKEG